MSFRIPARLATIVLAGVLILPVAAPAQQAVTDITALQKERRQLLEATRLADALPVAQRIADLSDGLSVPQQIGAYFDLASLRREAGDLDGAVLAYGEVITRAGTPDRASMYLGMVYDNLAMIRRAQEQWDAAETASDRALEIFQRTVGVRDMHYGAALNNRAVILGDQDKFVLALDYSERALNILREALKDDAAALAPFLKDNRWIRDQLPR
ncbi:MAG TPA: tetratricopeptide repeat protein [Vicinamibacterales bacterium]|nr:tetratricopeptide repeat protein [Vicinamibacterales bacterium]